MKNKTFSQTTQELWDCVDAKFEQATGSKASLAIAYMMINRCPVTNTRTNQSSRSCVGSESNGSTDINERVPVTGNDGKVYRNAYCAKCHGVTNVTYWGLEVMWLDLVKNGTNLTYESVYQCENCTWYVSPGNESSKSASRCIPSSECESLINTTESSKYTDLVNKCKVYSQLIEADGVLYKNFHCASCNGKDVMEFSKPPLNIRLPSLTLFFDYKSLSQESDDEDDSTATELTNKTEGTERGNKTEGTERGNKTEKATKRNKTKNSDESSHAVILGYVTVIGLSLSMACLLAVVMTYIRFTALRTVPGLVLLALSLSLMAYQGLILASSYGTQETPGCKALAILLHLMILFSFTWMTIMSYDVTKTFSRKGKFTACYLLHF